MNLKNQKNLVARSLGVSTKRIKFTSPTQGNLKEYEELISREAVKELLGEGKIRKLPKRGISKTRVKFANSQKKKGRRSGDGRKKGTQKARSSPKREWMVKIRALRSLLKQLKEQGRIDNQTYRQMYRRAKGNFFRNKRHLLFYLKQNDLLKEGGENDKQK